MRKSRIVLCGLVMAVFLIGSLALAKADPNAPCRKDPNAPWHKHFGAKMQEQLGLTDEQVAQMEQLRTANKEKMAAARQLTQEKRKALDQAVESGAGEEAIRAAAAGLGVALGDAAVLRAANLAEVKNILTPEQFAQWQAAKAERPRGQRPMQGPGKGPGAWGKGKGCEATANAEKPEGTMRPRGERGRMGPPDPEKIFAIKDTDGDGKLTLEEYTAGGRATAEHFAKADTNSDGFLTLQEFTDSIKQFMGRHRGPQ